VPIQLRVVELEFEPVEELGERHAHLHPRKTMTSSAHGSILCASLPEEGGLPSVASTYFCPMQLRVPSEKGRQASRSSVQLGSVHRSGL